MKPKPMSNLQRAVALVPLALLSAAWTAHIVTPNASAESDPRPRLPDGTLLPDSALKAPASVSPADSIARAIPKGLEDTLLEGESVDGIPAAALAAYQRAETVINAADESCKLPWELLAAVGRVESDHGRYGGNVLTDEAVAKPGVFGIALDGSRGTQAIRDTDAGTLDGDTTWDRAVGPMQFIPSTWAVVGVDGDSDGKRNPQDLDDAALSAAVYLCSGDEALSSRPGQETVVYRYNHSEAYVELVLKLMQAYMDGEYTAAPNNSSGTNYFTPAPTPFSPPPKGDLNSPEGELTSPPKPPQDDPQPPEDEPDPPETQEPPQEEPDPKGEAEDKIKDTVEEVPEVVEDVVTPLEEATAYCTKQGVGAQQLQACTDAYLKGGPAAVQNLLSSLGGLLG